MQAVLPRPNPLQSTGVPEVPFSMEKAPSNDLFWKFLMTPPPLSSLPSPGCDKTGMHEASKSKSYESEDSNSEKEENSQKFFHDGTPKVDIPPKKKRGRKNIDKSGNICQGCHTTETPEWRKGPNGKNTLCNACGLRWAKKIREEEHDRESLQKVKISSLIN
eukprot:TRINITY_DN1355_c0_g1_i1.p1 TRINITY_DN1355_c0_g1~~TRINITY_DN1355_c0_g1_i1.p1  ORF type:complete len:162 (-),score=43.26 TRINITY_DN1355_c0_g1_i1:337-822(-)